MPLATFWQNDSCLTFFSTGIWKLPFITKSHLTRWTEGREADWISTLLGRCVLYYDATSWSCCESQFRRSGELVELSQTQVCLGQLDSLVCH